MQKNKKGFTLIEVVVVLVVLAIIIALSVPAVMKYVEDANEAKYLAISRAITIETTTHVKKILANHYNENFDVLINNLSKQLSNGSTNEHDSIITTEAPENYELYSIDLGFDNVVQESGWGYNKRVKKHFISKISIWFKGTDKTKQMCVVIKPNKSTYFYSDSKSVWENIGKENGPELRV